MQIFSRNILQAAPGISVVAVVNLCLCCHSFLIKPREKKPATYLCAFWIAVTSRGLNSVVWEFVKRMQLQLMVRCAGKRAPGTLRFLQTLGWWLWGSSEAQTNWKQPVAASSVEVPEGKVKPPLLSFLPFERGFLSERGSCRWHQAPPLKRLEANPGARRRSSASPYLAGKQSS